MSKITGKNGKVMYGSVVVAEQVSWSMSGVSMPTIQPTTAFGATGTKEKVVADIPDAGTLEFNGNYDPADTAGQIALNEVCEVGTELTNLYLYVNTNTFWRVKAGGHIIVTKGKAITLPRNNYGTISFTGDISNQSMEQVGTGT